MGKHVKSFVAEVKKNRALFVMAMPAFLLVLIMQYLPMSGLVLAFKNYRYDLGVFGSEWNGFANFEYLFSSGTGWLITRNTVVYNLLNLVTSQLLAVLIAIFISEINKKIFKKVTQSIIFLPYFISWVIVGVFVYNIFNYETGILNSIVTFFGGEKINMYDASKAGIWPWIICLFNSWKWCGYNSVIYIAAITGVDAEIHEAASILRESVSSLFRAFFRPLSPCFFCRLAEFSVVISRCSIRSLETTDSSSTRPMLLIPMYSVP